MLSDTGFELTSSGAPGTLRTTPAVPRSVNSWTSVAGWLRVYSQPASTAFRWVSAPWFCAMPFIRVKSAWKASQTAESATVSSGAAGGEAAAAEQRKGPQVMYTVSAADAAPCAAPRTRRSNRKVAPSRATVLCRAVQVTRPNGVCSAPAGSESPEAPSTNSGVTRTGWEEDTSIREFGDAIAFFESVSESGQNAWPLQSGSTRAPGGVMLTTNGLRATSLIPAAAALQSLATGDSSVPATARTRRNISVSGSAATRWVVVSMRSAVAAARPASVAATCTSYAAASVTGSQLHSMKSGPLPDIMGTGTVSVSGAAMLVPMAVSLHSLCRSPSCARTRA